MIDFCNLKIVNARLINIVIFGNSIRNEYEISIIFKIELFDLFWVLLLIKITKEID